MCFVAACKKQKTVIEEVPAEVPAAAETVSSEVSKVPKLKLYYFNIAGKGEAIRLACAYGGVPLEDFRMHANEFHDLKVSGKLAFGQVPALSVNDDTILTQSAAIMRYVGKLTGLYPVNDDLYAAKIDMIVDSENDLFMGLSVSRYRGKQANKQVLLLLECWKVCHPSNNAACFEENFHFCAHTCLAFFPLSSCAPSLPFLQRASASAS